MNEPTRKSYGQHVLEDWKAPTETATMHDVDDARSGWEKEILKNINETVEKTLIDPHFNNKDFYILVLFKVERLGQSPRSWTFARQSCPTPTYNQNVWKYNRVSGTLDFLWSIPNEMMYYYVLRNAFNLPKENHEMVKFVTLMESGELLQWVLKENGEKPDGVIKENVIIQEPEKSIITSI
jgi:hypothetical protein